MLCDYLRLLEHWKTAYAPQPQDAIWHPLFAELTAELLNTLIEKITVHEAVKGEDGSREQEVEIYYRFIGKID